MSEKDAITNVANEIEALNNDEMEGKYLTFFADEQLFGIPIADVVQIVQMQEITEVPEFPSYAKGIINLRGSIIPVIDIRLRLGKMEREYDERTCIIVSQIDELLNGVIVDSVDEVTEIDQEAISPPPQVSNSTVDGYLNGIGKLTEQEKVVLLIDTHKLLGSGDYCGY